MAGKLAAVSVGSLLLLTLAFYSPITVGAQEDDSDPYGYKREMEEAINSTGISWDTVLRADISVPAGIGFSCNTDITKATATNVNELTPADIKVMGALGDSITAAFGAEAKTILTLMKEYKGVSWSIGGDDDLDSYTTLPNIIKKYNPNVRGFSYNKGGLFNSYKAVSKDNVAETGAVASAMPAQAQELVKRIKGDKSVDVDNDWKLITLWIGGNDLCRYCNDKDNKSPENYVNHIADALRILKSELPRRTFVNVVKILDVTRLEAVEEVGGLLCKVIHRLVCPCGIAKDNQETIQAQKDYNDGLEYMIDQDEFHTDEFTVVLQPFMENVDVPKRDNGKADLDYFALDCFHFTPLGHKLAAAALWNNMLEPVGQKSNDWEEDPTLKCPTEDFPYFYTKKNSQLNSFGAVLNGNLQGDGETSSVNLLALLLGVGVAALVVVVVIVGGVAGAVWYKRRQNRRRTLTGGTVMCDTEKVYLVQKI